MYGYDEVEATTLARELAWWSRWPIDSARKKRASKVETTALLPDDPRYVQAMRSYEESGLAAEVEKVGGVVLGAALEASPDMELPLVYISLWGGRVRMTVVRFAKMTVLRPDLRSRYEANYSFATVFEDGTEVITWGRSTVMTPSGERLVSVPGVGVFEDDLATHEAHVRERDMDVFRIVALGDAVEMTRHYYRHVIPVSMVRSMTMNRWIIGVQLIALVAMVIKFVFF